MKYLVIGTIVSLIGLGLIANKVNVIGIIILIIGIAIGLKGRDKLDKKNF